MTPNEIAAVAWLGRQLAWERRLARLRFEALDAKARPKLTRSDEASSPERVMSPETSEATIRV
jgi:hypothetical protein